MGPEISPCYANPGSMEICYQKLPDHLFSPTSLWLLWVEASGINALSYLTWWGSSRSKRWDVSQREPGKMWPVNTTELHSRPHLRLAVGRYRFYMDVSKIEPQKGKILYTKLPPLTQWTKCQARSFGTEKTIACKIETHLQKLLNWFLAKMGF